MWRWRDKVRTRTDCASDWRWCGCSRSHQGWSQSPGRCPSCPGWQWEQGLSRNLSQSRKMWQPKEQIYGQGQLDGRKTSQSSVSQLSNHLFGKPGAASLSDPLPGVDSSVDPDGGAVGSTSAELGRGWKRGNKYSEQWTKVRSFSTDLKHVQGATLVAAANHNFADQAGILSHQHVLETVDLKGNHTWVCCRPDAWLVHQPVKTSQP